MRKCLFVIFVSFVVSGSACSGIHKSFCAVRAMQPGNNVICGVITSTASHAINLNVVTVMSGAETRSVITIWDGTDFDCNGPVSMKVSDMGNVGDTIIAILPIITTTLENTWDVPGDYRRPNSLFLTPWLTVKLDTVRGYAAGTYTNGGPFYLTMKYPYPDFKNYWQAHGNGCIALSIHETLPEKFRVNIADGRITVDMPPGESLSISLYSLDGRLLAIPTHGQQEIICSHLPHGVYLLTLGTNGNAIQTRKIVL